MTNRTTCPFALLALLPVLSLFALPNPATAGHAPSKDTLIIDGKWDDWKNKARLVADENFIYVRFETPDQRTLLRHNQTVRFDFNTDKNLGTGRPVQSRLDPKGIDLSVELNPAPEPGSTDRFPPGVRVTTYNESGKPTPLSLGKISVYHGPTHASQKFELRIQRAQTKPITSGLTDKGTLALTISLIDKQTGQATLLAKHTARVPRAKIQNESATKRAAYRIPTKPQNAIRVVTWNTLWGSQLKTPAPFARIAKALDADVYLLQEWNNRRYAANDVAQWFSQNLGGLWNAVTTESTGNRSTGIAIATRFPIHDSPRPPGTLWTNGKSRSNFPVRFTAAIIDTPQGPGLFATIHHKAGGRIHSDEDLRRFEEAALIQSTMADLQKQAKPKFTVYGGDFNLNGSYNVTKTATHALDTDGSPLTIATPQVLARPGLVYTHGRGHEKRRLDFLTYSDAALTVQNAFVLDTHMLDEQTLHDLNLETEDSQATDHFPAVIDLVPAR